MNYDFYNMSSYGNYVNNNNGINKTNSNNLNNQLFNIYEGYSRGNLFKNLYEPYKNYEVPKVRINSEKEEMMFNIGEYSFLAHEMNLYLDNYPDNQEALNLFNEYQSKLKVLMENYERKYGPLNLSSDNMKNVPFTWVSKEWPWVS